MKKNLLIFGFFLALILFFTHGLFNNYFEQDEWGAFGDLIYSQNLPWWNFLISRGVHFLPFGLLYWSFLYTLFKLNAQYYIFIELLTHAFISFLVYVLSSRLTKNKAVGILSGILFALNGRSDQGFMHLAIFSTTGNTLIFIFLFFIYLTSIKQKLLSFKNVGILFLIFMSAVFFREEGFIIIPLLFVYLYLFDRAKLNTKNIRQGLLFLVGFIFLVISRSVSQSLNTTPVPANAHPSFGSALYNLPTLPVKFIIQNIVNSTDIFNFLYEQNRGLKIYPDVHATFLTVYPLFMDLAFAVVFTVLLAIVFIWFIFQKKKKILLQYGAFALSWILLNSFVLAFVGRRLYMVEERYLYFSSYPVMFMLSIILVSVFTSSSRTAIASSVKKLSVLVICAVILLSSYGQIQALVKQKAAIGNAKRKFLESMVKVHPVIPKNTVFYITCKGVCHGNERFGLSSEWVLPFSSGAGWNILVLYASRGNEKTWGKFLHNDFLLNLNAQGYEKIGEMGFGYYVDREKLKKEIELKHISIKNVIALEYNESDFSVKDISKKTEQLLYD